MIEIINRGAFKSEFDIPYSLDIAYYESSCCDCWSWCGWAKSFY